MGMPVVAKVKITHQTRRVSCGFSCQKGKLQMGHDMAHSKEADQGHCAKKCCMTKGCIGFDFDHLLKDCWLSKTPWSKVPPTGGLLALTKTTCQKNGVHDNPKLQWLPTSQLQMRNLLKMNTFTKMLQKR